MATLQTVTKAPVTSANVVDGAVGVEGNHWYVAVVNNNSERTIAAKLMDKKMGNAYECYVPTQREKRVWKNGRKNEVDRILFPALLFIRCSERKRIEAKHLGYVKNFLVDHTKGCKGHYPVAIIPDTQIQQLKIMLEKSVTTVTIEDIHFRFGDAVKVTSGPLTGVEGNIVIEPKGSYLVIAIDSLGYAKVQINQNEIKKIN